MATTSEERAEPTPRGGVRSVIYYRAANGDPADKAVAVAAEVIEYDAAGKEIARTYATLTPKRKGEP